MRGVKHPCERCKTRGRGARKGTLCHDCRREVRHQFSTHSDNSPMERAIRRVERVTGAKREGWEHQVNHPYGRAADKYAKYLAGYPTTPTQQTR